MPLALSDVTLFDVVAVTGLYLVASLLCAGLVVRIAATSWPGQIFRRKIWSFPFAPVLGIIAALRLALLITAELADRGVRATFYAVSGRRASRRITLTSYGRPQRSRYIRRMRSRSNRARSQEVQAGWSRPTR